MHNWTEEQKRQQALDQAIHRHLKGEVTQKQAAESLGIARQTFNQLVQKFAQSTSLDRRRRFDLATHLHTHFGFVLQALIPWGGDLIRGLRHKPWGALRVEPWPAGHVWVCPPFDLGIASAYYTRCKAATDQHGSTVISVCPSAWENNPTVTGAAEGILTPLGQYHVRRYSNTDNHKITRYLGPVRVLVFRPGTPNKYTNTIPEPST